MSQHAVITDGFGTFGSPSLVITEGYSSGAESPFPLCISIGMQLEYGITTAQSVEYGITIEQSKEYGITISQGGCA